MKKPPRPSRREEVALFRLGVIGDLLARELAPGELQAELKLRAQRRYRPPGAKRTRTYHWKTLQRWLHTARKAHAAQALQPASRAKGYARALNPEQRELLLAMRRHHPSASAELILGEAVRHGVLAEGQVSLSTLRRLFREADLPRRSRTRAQRGRDVQRRRWQAAHPGDIWHADVCHVALSGGRKALVHGFLDDASRYFVALVARAQETERDMLEVFCGALLKHAPPRVLFLDNGACYRGEVLRLVCSRLGIHLVHARPHDPESRGKMERAWRTMRQRCTDHLPPGASLHQVDVALWSWLDVDYHRRAHAALLGNTPRRRYLEGQDGCRRPLSPTELAAALETEVRRQVRKDGTFQVEGVVYEALGHHLAGKRIDIVVDGLTGQPVRASYRGVPLRFGPCDPVANRHRRRGAPPADKPGEHPPFDPIAALLQRAREDRHE